MSVTRLSAAEQTKALEKYDEMQEKKLASGNAVNEFVNKAKASLLFQYNWEELLSAAPMSINLIGSCYIATSLSRATEIELELPASGSFEFLPSTSLRACMVGCGDLGLRAFMDMGPRMNRITVVSKSLYKDVNIVIMCLEGGPDAITTLKIALNNLKKGSQDCSNQAAAVDKSLTEWLKFVEELHRCCCAKETSVAIQRSVNETQLASKQAQQTANATVVTAAKKAMDDLGESLTTAREAYKKASDEFPSGWNVVGQQFCAGLGQTVNNALNACIPALVAKLNPVAQVGQVVDVFRSDKSTAGSGDKPKESVAAQGTVAQQPDVLPADYNDPAYTAVGTVADVADMLKAILTGGPDGNIDWEAARPKPGEKDHGAGFVLNMLDFSLKQFKPSTKAPSQKFVAALKKAVQVAKDFKAAADSHFKMGGKEVDAATVEKWQNAVQEATDDFAVLRTTADMISKSTPPMINPGDLVKASQASGSVATAILDKAAERVTTTQKTLLATQETYQKASQSYVEIARVQAEIAAELVNLGKSEIGLAEIKAILTKCIESLVQLKAQVRKLVAYFAALAEMIAYIQGDELQRFSDFVNGVIEDDRRSLNGFTTIDITRQVIFNSAVLLRAYFSLFADIAQMWVEINARYLLQGSTLVDGLAQETQAQDKSAFNRKVADLKKWTGDATEGIKNIAKSKQEEIMDGMMQRAAEAAEDVKLLPPMPAKKLQAIEEGKAVVVKAAIEGIENYKPPVVARSFGSTRSLLASM